MLRVVFYVKILQSIHYSKMTAKEIINCMSLMFDENRPPGQADLNIVLNQSIA